MVSALEIKQKAIELGADLVGITDLRRVEGIPTLPQGLLEPYTHAVVIAVAITPDVFEQIRTEPTPLYLHHYLATNTLLDNINLCLQRQIMNEGFHALAIPASQIVDKVNWMGHISHKAMAKAAGLGWQGKSLLLVTPKYGPRVRLATLLTNAPFEPDPLLPNRCGICQECQEACPAAAIKGASWEDHPQTREEALHFTRCVEKVNEDFAKRPEIGKPICGVCISVCPWGKPKK
ncbi:4Fe-4S double cluster binding domain-containing protein [Desulfosporosinus metallidurans]|uniref:Iron-sulfur cluster-binding protein n=1 Tax=Desulfosporosinus metallidurans TaxID=1888891 RepID=A0A1Q8QP16_9FIRM|nr:4Fe-4S double cluster binding domain-containing protein [Desulfosporosinus metallidurans]OLN29085.1 Iron-sulfur cluster-binding protein [Desulfosporosinus metallidurans]